jgi:glycosyltransferase involved in cell wall biosynthesis
MSVPSATELSVIIPTRDRCVTVLACLAELFKQSGVDGQLEIIVVDDGSQDDTISSVRRLQAPAGVQLVAVTQQPAGANAARNRGVAAATGRIVSFINDDSLPVKGWAAEHLRIHRSYPQNLVCVLGAIRDSPDLSPSLFNELHRPAGLDGLGEGALLSWRHFFTYNLSVKRVILADYPFNNALKWHEDIELGRRLARLGMTLRFAPSALVFHHHEVSEQDYFRMAEREGQALAQWYRETPDAAPDLIDLGLRARVLQTRAVRHIVADLLVQNWTYSAWLQLARFAAGLERWSGKLFYRKLYQWRSRRALEFALAQAGSFPVLPVAPIE